MAMNLSFKATDVARACLAFLHKDLDTPAARERLSRELFELIDQIKLFAAEFGLTICVANRGGDA